MEIEKLVSNMVPVTYIVGGKNCVDLIGDKESRCYIKSICRINNEELTI